MWPNPQETVDLVTFTEDIFNGQLHFLCSANFMESGINFSSEAIATAVLKPR